MLEIGEESIGDDSIRSITWVEGIPEDVVLAIGAELRVG